MKKDIKIQFCKFFKEFDPKNNFFIKLLSKHYNIILSDKPDYVIYSVFPGEMPKGDYVRIFYASENIRPNFNECDWAFTFDYDDKIQNSKHLRLPISTISFNCQSFIDPPSPTVNIEEVIRSKNKFCAFIYSNPVPIRNKFFHLLSKYKKIDSPGRCLRNMEWIGSSWEDKLDFLKQYKFAIAFENSSYPGYTTEKIVHAMQANCIPLYWGNPLIHRDFNPKSFINYHDLSNNNLRERLSKHFCRSPYIKKSTLQLSSLLFNPKPLIQKIIEIDQDEQLYRHYLSQPWFLEGQQEQFSQARYLQKLQQIFY